VTSTDQINARIALSGAVDALRAGEISFVEGVRRVVSLRDALRAPVTDPDFMVLVALDSESDHLPNSVGKLMASDSWLADCTAEERELQNRHGVEVLAACERLLARFAQ
jgi:hypothetical protein